MLDTAYIVVVVTCWPPLHLHTGAVTANISDDKYDNEIQLSLQSYLYLLLCVFLDVSSERNDSSVFQHFIQ